MEIVQNPFHTRKDSFLSWEIIITNFKSGFIHEEDDISLAFYDERNGRIKEDVQFLGSVRRVFAESFFGPSNVERFRVVIVKGDGGAIWFAQTLHLFHPNT